MRGRAAGMPDGPGVARSGGGRGRACVLSFLFLSMLRVYPTRTERQRARYSPRFSMRGGAAGRPDGPDTGSGSFAGAD